MKDAIVKLVRQLANLRIMVFCSLWLMILLVAGTLAQPSMGLFQAQQRFFSCWLTDTDPFPLPGGRLAMTVLFVNLVCYLILGKGRKWRKPGLLITHLGALLLLLGGFLTAITAREGNMVIPEGKSASYVSDYHTMELAFTNTASPDYDQVVAFGKPWLKPGKVLAPEGLNGEVEVLAYYPNCTPRMSTSVDQNLRGFAQRYQLVAKDLDPQSERNRPGLLFRLKSGDPALDGDYALIDGMSVPQTLGSWQLELRKTRTYLPFQLELVDFEKQLHPGTNMPRAFSSDLFLVEGSNRRRVVVEMNQPLRHQGYTFYQSSYVENGPQETTVLAVVYNQGRLFPYIASLVMCLGLLIHLLSRLPKLISNRQRAATGGVW